MEDYLKSLYTKNGIEIFKDNFNFLDQALLQNNTDDHFKYDAVLIHKILSGNKFYQIATEQLNNNKYFTQNIYNIFLSQLYKQDVLWEDSSSYRRMEELFRVPLQLINIDVSQYKNLISLHLESHHQSANGTDMLKEAVITYANANYRQGFSMLKNAFNYGAKDASGMLGLCYYYGLGTRKNYNQALKYLTFPQNRVPIYKDEQIKVMKELIEAREKSKIQAICFILSSLLIFTLMLMFKVFISHYIISILFSIILIGGMVFFALSLKDGKICDVSLWNIMIMCMFFTILIL